ASSEQLRGEIVASSEQLRGEIVASSEQLRGEIVASSEQLRGEIAASEERLRGEVVASEERMKKDFRDGIQIVHENASGANDDRHADHGNRLDNHEYRIMTLEGRKTIAQKV
ncbi:MAG: hypothetical protein PHZ00_05895, partial [Candidatus Peribacteraceae bacterium]|nr:hypothetical protein [Candidatus Peribacteraceae bacterium]